jgi:hypothetical protein
MVHISLREVVSILEPTPRQITIPLATTFAFSLNSNTSLAALLDPGYKECAGYER